MATLVELTPVTSAIKIIVWQSTVVVPLWDSSGVTMSSSVSGSSLQLFFPPKGAFLLLTVFLYYVHSTIYHIPHKWSSILFCYSSQQFCIALSGFVLLFLNLHKIFLHTLVSSFSWKICFCFWKVFFFFFNLAQFLKFPQFLAVASWQPPRYFFLFPGLFWISLSHSCVHTPFFSEAYFSVVDPSWFLNIIWAFCFLSFTFFFLQYIVQETPSSHLSRMMPVPLTSFDYVIIFSGLFSL